MIGVAIDFTGLKPTFDFTRTVTDFDNTVQNTMVNIGTNLNSDPVYPDRGTYILQDGVRGRMVNLQWANHEANFAAARTMVFIKGHSAANDAFGLQDLKLQAATYNNYRLSLYLFATCVDGSTRGVNASI